MSSSRARSVTLGEMLARREARVAAREQLLARFGQPVISLTLVTPGAVKSSPQTSFVFDEARVACNELLNERRRDVLYERYEWLDTGPEAMWCVDASPVDLKQVLVHLEESHPLGRLWDFDVVDSTGLTIDRRQLALPRRACLVCDEPAHACSRSRRHSLADLLYTIDARVDRYQAHRHAA